MAVGAQQDLDFWPMVAQGADQTAHKAADLDPLGRLPGRSSAVTKRPSASNTTIGWKP